MKPLLIPLIALLTLALPVGLTTELITAYGYTIVQSASSSVRGQYPVRQQLLRELTDDSTYPLSLIEDWEWQAQRSLNEPLPLLLPYAEGWLALPDRSQAVTFTVLAQEGRVLEVNTQRDATAQGGLVIEVFDQEGGDYTQPVASIGPTDDQLRWPVLNSGTYRIRVQSTPGTAGAFALALDERFALDFPVDTDAEEPVRSFFGMPRDGGRREHHGIDIFAPRNTPVLAAADGYVSRVGTSPRGGLHIWQRASDESGKALGTLYYAHLEDTFVTAGTWVDRGTPIGTVGNSGNAISTPPHLHFGLYQRFKGPLDPLPLTGPVQRPSVLMSSGHRWPVWVSINRESVNVRAGPGTEFTVMATVGRGELVQVEAATAGWLRVRTGNGETGFLSAALVGALQGQTLMVVEESKVQASPENSSATLVTLQGQENISLLGRFGPARYVETDTGLRGWIIDAVAEDEEPAS